MSTDNATTGTPEPEIEEPRWMSVAFRRLGKHGASLMLCVPSVFVRRMNVWRGAEFKLVIDKDGNGFHARVIDRGRSRVEPDADGPAALRMTG